MGIRSRIEKLEEAAMWYEKGSSSPCVLNLADLPRETVEGALKALIECGAAIPLTDRR